MVTEKYLYLAMELESRSLQEKRDYLKMLFESNERKIVSSVFDNTKMEVLSEAFIYLDAYGGEDLSLDDIDDWFKKAKTQIIELFRKTDVNSHQKKDEDALLGNHLEPRNIAGEGNLQEKKPVDMDNHGDTLRGSDEVHK